MLGSPGPSVQITAHWKDLGGLVPASRIDCARRVCDKGPVRVSLGVRAAALAVAAAATSPAPSAGAAQPGLSARFGWIRAVAGVDLRVPIAIDDGYGAVRRVTIELRAEGTTTWSAVEAQPPRSVDEPWVGVFPAALLPPPPSWIELRASVLGGRGGLLLDLGGDSPYVVEVLTPTRAKRDDLLLRGASGGESALDLIGNVGLEARVASSARLRIYLGGSAGLGSHTELLLGVTVGPAFARPSQLSGGGPLVLGAELALRGYGRSPDGPGLAPYAELYGGGDLRLPGFDPYAGLRLGLTIRLNEATSLDLAAGGAVIVFRAAGDEQDPLPGFTGSLRIGMRFGAPKAAKPSGGGATP